MRIKDKKPEKIFTFIHGDSCRDIYHADDMDEWVDKLIMNYENRLLRMSKKIKELRLSTQV